MTHVPDIAAEQDGNGGVAVQFGHADLFDESRRDLGVRGGGQRQELKQQGAADCTVSHQSNFVSVMRCCGPERLVRIVVSVESV